MVPRPFPLALLCGALLAAAARGGDPETKFLGTWVSKSNTDGLEQYLTISRADGKWNVRGFYKKDGAEAGSYVGEGVTFDGALQYAHKYVKKPGNFADNLPVTLKPEGDRLRYSWVSKGVTKTKLIGRVDEPAAAVKVEPKARAAPPLDPAAEKLLGTFAARVDPLTSIFTIAHEGGEWKVDGLFKERGRDVGGFHGTDVRYEKGALTFKQKFFLKPRSDWKDEEKFTIRLVGNSVIGLPDRPNAAVRTFEHLDAPTQTLAAPAKDDPRRFLGTYQGSANDGHRGLLVIGEKAGSLTYQVTWSNAAGKVVGATVGIDLRAAEGGLVLVQRHLRKPAATWHDNATIRLELADNTLVQTRQEGTRWAPGASFTRVKR